MAAGDRRLGVYGIKVYSTGKGGTRFMVMLYDSATGDLLAMIEADRLGQMRTGAASGVATKYMAREDADTAGIFGTGWQAETQIMAICAVRKLRVITVYGRDPERRKAFAEKMAAITGVDVVPAASAEGNVKAASIIVTATSAREPVLTGQWIEAGTHVNAAGSNFLSKSEIDVEAIRKASVIAVDSVEQAKLESGDLLPAIERGVITWESVNELGRIVAGQVVGRRSASDVTLFKSNGIALWDIATALRVYNAAQERGIGETLELWRGGA
jgi:alanine dehydrogenase